jgi:hypothetical protein
MPLDEGVGHAEAEASAFATFCAKEGVKNAWLYVFWYASAGI